MSDEELTPETTEETAVSTETEALQRLFQTMIH